MRPVHEEAAGFVQPGAAGGGVGVIELVGRQGQPLNPIHLVTGAQRKALRKLVGGVEFNIADE